MSKRTEEVVYRYEIRTLLLDIFPVLCHNFVYSSREPGALTPCIIFSGIHFMLL